MYQQKNIAVVIPARGGSRGIRRKNVRGLAGKPLIAHAILTALRSRYVDHVSVSTEDDFIARIARGYGADVIRRPAELAGDDVTLDPVVFHAVQSLEEKRSFDVVVTMQPTSPTLKPATLDAAIRAFFEGDWDTLLAVTDARHLYWEHAAGGVLRPLYQRRVNRQLLPEWYAETGGFMVSKRSILTSSSRIGQRVSVFRVPSEESVDIDGVQDWWVAENALAKKRVAFVTVGDAQTGLGHVYRCLSLADEFRMHHDVCFLLPRSHAAALAKVSSEGYPIHAFDRFASVPSTLSQVGADLVIHDCLDTTRAYVRSVKRRVPFVVNLDDVGDGAAEADWVVNPLRTRSATAGLCGPEHLPLREEFFLLPPRAVRRSARQVLIAFGGVDANDLTARTLRALQSLDWKGFRIVVLLGPGYSFQDSLLPVASGFRGADVVLKRDAPYPSLEFSESDFAVTSRGTLLFELAAMQVPSVCISQNEREARQPIEFLGRGVRYLGVADRVDGVRIRAAVKDLLNFKKRAEMVAALKPLRFSSASDMVKRILDAYDLKAPSGNFRSRF